MDQQINGIWLCKPKTWFRYLEAKVEELIPKFSCLQHVSTIMHHKQATHN